MENISKLKKWHKELTSQVESDLKYHDCVKKVVVMTKIIRQIGGNVTKRFANF